VCRAFSAHPIRLIYPGLTAGPIHLRSFGPHIHSIPEF
jgi:hypothetical protein